VSTAAAEAQLRALARRMADGGANLTVESPVAEPIAVGRDPSRTRVVLRTGAALDALLRGDHLALAEAYLQGAVDIEGDIRQALFVTDHLDLVPPSRLRQAAVWLRFLLDRRRLNRASIAHHYDRPPEFFLAWLDPSRSYTHGFYASRADDLATAQRRKLQYAIDALGLGPGMNVLDVGCGWGSFLEHAGAQGIRVHGITLSRDQHRYVSELIDARSLPCTVELVDFLDYRPTVTFDAAVFMGSLEHLPDHRHLGRFLARHLAPHGAVYADFVSTRANWIAGAFLRKYIFPGVSGYVQVGSLVATLTRAGFNVRELADDTPSCAWTVRDWALRLEARRPELAERHGEATVRAFLLYLWSSHHFLERNRTQAYHLVAARTPGPSKPPEMFG
jgi:cyclopropane-fatty-acyl-phospholipid synthase